MTGTIETNKGWFIYINF